jgi:hypothetical protein
VLYTINTKYIIKIFTLGIDKMNKQKDIIITEIIDKYIIIFDKKLFKKYPFRSIIIPEVKYETIIKN